MIRRAFGYRDNVMGERDHRWPAPHPAPHIDQTGLTAAQEQSLQIPAREWYHGFGIVESRMLRANRSYFIP